MKYRLFPVIKRIMKVLNRYDLKIERMKEDHIIINKTPSLIRPIVLVNKKRLSNIVKINLLKSCDNIGILKEELENIF